MEKCIENVRYFGQWSVGGTVHTKPLNIIGIDTEAYTTGHCFLICTSWGDAWDASQWPACAFSRKYRGEKFAAWNLSYDEGALLQWLSKEKLGELRQEGKIESDGWKVTCIPKKMLRIARKSHSITIYDMYQFYASSLDRAAEKYLGERKLEMETKSFTPEYVLDNYDHVKKYCIQDAVLVERLGHRLMKVFEGFGITPTKLYSTAYVSFQYFKSKCHYPTVKKLWESERSVLGAAMSAYRGGKFEVTTKGVNHYVEYDIISAYPAEIARLIDITDARIVCTNKWRASAIYAFLQIKIKIPFGVASPISTKIRGVSIYPVGEFQTWCTKREYEYLERAGCDLTILKGYWIHVTEKRYPFENEIGRLVELKQKYKNGDTALEYHTVKILLNSLYGKMCQLIKTKEYWKASSCWNPIYAAEITANVRIRVSELQTKYPSIVAVHTDSIISTRRLPIPVGTGLGDWAFEREGRGVILGSGVYQIGDKARMRGFDTRLSLMGLIDTPAKSISLSDIHAISWRECIFRDWNIDHINRFQPSVKRLRPNFDTKRIWVNDYKTFRDVLRRNVESLPIDAKLLGLLF